VYKSKVTNRSLGGVEYGEEIALEIDFFTAQKADVAFKHFLNELRSSLQPFFIR